MRRLILLAVLASSLAVPAPALAQTSSGCQSGYQEGLAKMGAAPTCEELVQECRPGVEAQEREEAKYEAKEAEGPEWVLPPSCATARVYEEAEEQIDESRPPERLVVGTHVKPLGALGAWYGVTLEIGEADRWGWIEVHVWGALKRSYVWHLIPEGRGAGSVHLEWPCSPPHDGPIRYSVTETRGGKSITRRAQIQPRKATYCKRRAEAERHRIGSAERERLRR